MAAPVVTPDGDPFPLLHLADLSFDISSPASLADLAAYQLAFAPWSASWDDSMAAALKRTWRRRREKARPLITAREPMGIHAPLELQQQEQFPRFECVDLAFDLDPTNDDLDHLSSAQLAAVQFHPAATKDLVMAAEDVFFTRRERDFAAGLSLPPFPPSASTSSSSCAPAPVTAAPAPASGPHAPTPPATSPATPTGTDPTLAPLPARAPTASRLPPRTAAPPPLPPAPSNSMGAPPRAGAAATATLAASSSASSSSSRIPAFARPPVPAPALVAQPQQSSSSSASASGSRVPASASSARDGAAHTGERERDRARDEEPRRDRERDREHDARRERSRERDYDASRSHDRASSSRRSERERERSLSPGTAQRERERAEYKAAKAARAREDEERERERGERRRKAGEGEREDGRSARDSSSRRSSRADETGRRAERDREEGEGRRDRDDRERDSGSRPSSSRAYSRVRSRSRSPAARRDSGHETSLATPSSRKRAVSPARSDYSHASSSVLRSSTRRRLDDADYVSAPAPASTPPTGPRRQTPPPDQPQAFEPVPMELLSRLNTVFLRHFPGRLSAGDIADFVHHGAPTARSEPVAIKCHSKPNQDFGLPGEAGLQPDVTLAFVMYDETDIDSARELVRCTDGSRFRDRKITASKGAPQTTSSWRWSDFNPSFVEAHYRRQLAAHAAARHASPARADSRSAAVMTGFVADRAPPPDVPAVPHASTSAGPSADPGRAGRRASTVPPPVPLPPHLHAKLSTLYVSNVAADTDLGECRDYFDPCEGIVGLSLSEVSSSLRQLRFRDAWLTFETARDRERARHGLMGGKYPGAAVKLWVEMAELRAQNQGEEHQWLWSEMSKDYRSRHAAELEAASRDSVSNAARGGAGARGDYAASNPPTAGLQQQQASQASPTLDPRRRPSQQSSSTSSTAAPTALRFFPAGQPLPPSSTIDPFMSASSSSSISNGPTAPSSRLPAPAQAPPPPDAYSPLAAALPFGIFSTSHPPHPHAYSASHQQQQSSSAPATRPSTVVPRPGPQTVFSSGSSAHPSDTALMRPPSAPAAPSPSSALPPPRAPRGAGFMDPARAALLASAGIGASATGGDALVDEPMQLDDDEPIAVGDRRPTAAEERARAEEAARSAWGARRGGAAAVGAQVQQGGAHQQENGSQGPQSGTDGRPRSLSLGIKGLASSSAASTSAGARSPAATPSAALEPSPAPGTPAPAVDASVPAATAAVEVAPSISASALEALGAALKLQGLPTLGSTIDGAGDGAGETP
ncbi:hypothetical protein JCM9279_002051 [Rhodotorula babjevae]